MKRTCKSCKAFGVIGNQCALGHSIQLHYYDTVFVIGATPLEECPKPKTNTELVKLMIK